MSYTKLHEFLKSLPEKKLISGTYTDGVNCCVIGTLLKDAGLDPSIYEGSFTSMTKNVDLYNFSGKSLSSFADQEVMDIANRFDLAPSLLRKLQLINDQFSGSEEERYNHVLQFVAEQERLQDEPK